MKEQKQKQQQQQQHSWRFFFFPTNPQKNKGGNENVRKIGKKISGDFQYEKMLDKRTVLDAISVGLPYNATWQCVFHSWQCAAPHDLSWKERESV